MRPASIFFNIQLSNSRVDAVRELITRETYPAPKVSLNPEIKDFYDFTTADLIVENYEAGPQITNIPIAV